MAEARVTVTILTKNEEALIARCIASLWWADEVLVLDSGSTDRTVEIATGLGAVVHHQPWLGWTPQRQRGISLARNDWVMVCEADEIVTDGLAQSIRSAMANNPNPDDGYAVDRRDELFGRLLPNMRRAARLNSFVRLFNRTRSRYNPDEVIHETVITPGRMVLLDGLLLHWRNVSLEEQLRKDVDIALLEADLEGEHARVGPLRIVAMPLLRFLWCYVRMGAFRVGTVGLIYSLMRAHSEFQRTAILWERQHAKPTLNPPIELWKARARPAVEASPRPPSRDLGAAPQVDGA